MPMLNLSVSTPLSSELASNLSAALTRATNERLGKDPSVTAVLITHAPADHWFIGNASLASMGKNAFWLEIKVTAGTNTKAQYADYLKDVFAMMRRALGPLHETSYIVIDEVNASAWGYAGLSQEHRFDAGRIAAA